MHDKGQGIERCLEKWIQGTVLAEVVVKQNGTPSHLCLWWDERAWGSTYPGELSMLYHWTCVVMEFLLNFLGKNIPWGVLRVFPVALRKVNILPNNIWQLWLSRRLNSRGWAGEDFIKQDSSYGPDLEAALSFGLGCEQVIQIQALPLAMRVLPQSGLN